MMQLTEEQRAAFNAFVARDLPSFALVVADDRFSLTEVAQDLFIDARILRLELATRPLKKAFYVARTDAGWLLLTGRIDSFNALADGWTSAIKSAKQAREVARFADSWTTTWEHGQLEVSSFNEIPWRSYIEERDRQTIEAARAQFADAIGPETVEETDGKYVFKTWVVVHAKLLRRTLQVTTSAHFKRVDEVAVALLPVPLGRTWTLVDGRMIPTG